VVLGAMIALFVIALGVLWLARSSSTFANLKPGSPNSEVEAPSHQPAGRPHELLDHPFEYMGIASLSPSTGMPEDAISEAQAIDRVTESTWGAYRDELIKDYPPSVILAVYNASESVMGPAAQERPVWVVTLEG
jgi:hypothetical protein